MKKRLSILLAVLALLFAGCAAEPAASPETTAAPLQPFLQASFPEDGSVTLTCGEETLSFSMDTMPVENIALGNTQIEVLSPGAVRAVFGDSAILFLAEGAEAPDVTADLVWGHVTQSHGSLFAILPEPPSDEQRQSLETQGMTLLIPAELGPVAAESAGTEFFLSWTATDSAPAMSDAK